MRIGFIGAGQMARALAAGFVATRSVAATSIWASDCSQTSREQFLAAVPEAHVTASNMDVLQHAEMIWLAVKPQTLPAVYRELSPLPSDRLVVSIAAGISLRQLEEGLGTRRIVRVMPNVACQVQSAASGYCAGAAVTPDDVAWVDRLLQTVGRCWQLPEHLLHAVTGLSGSGPAFVFQFIEALSDGGVLMGLPRDTAIQLAAQTVLGAAQMLLATGEHPGVLKDRVASPAGTTIAGIQALESHAFRGAVIHAVQAATERSRALEQAAK